MSKIVSGFKAFIADENGVTAMEYGLIAALIAAGIVTAVGLIGGKLQGTFEFIEGQLPSL